MDEIDSNSRNRWLLALVFLPTICMLVFCLGGFLVVARVVELPDTIRREINAFINPTPVVTSTMMLDRIRDMALLETARHDFSIWVSSQRNIPYVLSALYGDRVEYVAVGYVTAGVDLEAITEGDIVVDQATGAVTLYLPQAQLLDCVLDESKSHVVNRATGVFVGASPEVDEAVRDFARAQFVQGAGESDILGDAERQAQTVLTTLAHALGVEAITLIFKPDSRPIISEDSSCFIAPTPSPE